MKSIPLSGSAFPVLLCALAALLFGASTPISKSLLGSIGPLTLAGLLYIGGAIGVLPFAFRGGSIELRRDRRQRGMLALAVLCGGGLGPVLLLFGLRSAPAASVSLWLNLETVATALIAWAFFHEHLDRRTIIAAGLVIAGGIILVSPQEAAGWRPGTLVALACVCWGLDNNLTALVSGFTAAQTTMIKGIFAGSVNLALGAIFEGSFPVGQAVLAPLLLGAFAYGLSIMLYIMGAQQLGAARSQLIFASSPYFGMILAWTIFGEPVQLLQILSAIVMATGIVLMTTSRHEHEHTHEGLNHTHAHRHDDGHHTHVHHGLPASTWHTHPHVHEPMTHSHPHVPDLHHRHEH